MKNLSEEGKELAGVTAELESQPTGQPFTTLNQESYKDDNGRDVSAAAVDCLAPYIHICDGFYKWECGRCRHEEGSRACGWPIAGQVLKCSECNAQNLLVKTNTIQLDGLVGKKNELDLGLMRLASDRATFDAEVKRVADHRLYSLKDPLKRLLAEIEAAPNGQATATASAQLSNDTAEGSVPHLPDED